MNKTNLIKFAENDLFGIEYHGPGISPRLRNGDGLLVDPNRKPKDGDVVVIDSGTGEEIMIVGEYHQRSDEALLVVDDNDTQIDFEPTRFKGWQAPSIVDTC